MKKRIVVGICIIGVLIFALYFRFQMPKKETILDEVILKEPETSDNNGFAYMLEQVDGTYSQSFSRT